MDRVTQQNEGIRSVLLKRSTHTLVPRCVKFSVKHHRVQRCADGFGCLTDLRVEWPFPALSSLREDAEVGQLGESLLEKRDPFPPDFQSRVNGGPREVLAGLRDIRNKPLCQRIGR